MKDHEKRELVDRLTKLAQEFADTQQLRARIAGEVLPALVAVQTGERERCAKAAHAAIHSVHPAMRQSADVMMNAVNRAIGYPI